MRTGGNGAQPGEIGGLGVPTRRVPLSPPTAEYFIRVRRCDDGFAATLRKCVVGRSPHVRAVAEPIATGVAPTAEDSMAAVIADARFPNRTNGPGKTTYNPSKYDPPTL
jgi:hypothetical protein